MRVFSIATALIVAAIIYVFVFQRELIYNLNASLSDQEKEVERILAKREDVQGDTLY